MPSIRDKKYAYWEKLWTLLEEAPQILIAEANNVGSKQLQLLRVTLRGKATLLFGKNTLIRAGIKHRMKKPEPDDEDYETRKDNWTPCEELNELLPLLKGNVCMIFCHIDMSQVLEIVEASKVPAEAKAGTIAPCDVYVYPGATGMDPSQTSFFQALGIFTKIVKGQIDIINELHLIFKDKKVGNSEAVLLKKLNQKPFSFGLIVSNVYDKGSVYTAAVLKLNDEVLIGKFLKGVQFIAALSLELGIPTAASVPHSIVRGFKNIVSIAHVTDYSFSQAQGLLEVLKDPSKLAAMQSGPAATKTEAPKAAEVAKESDPSDADADMGGLFGDDDDF